MQKPIQRVKFTKAIARHAYIRDQNPSLGLICPGEPYQRKPNAPKFEDRSQEETEWQERCAREAAWRLAESILIFWEKIKQHSSNLGKIGACLRHQILNLRNENLLSTLERRCTWSATRTWMMVKWVLWGNRVVRRQSKQQKEKCRRMKMSKNWIYSWLSKSSRIRQQYCRLESFSMKTDILMNGSMVKNHISLRTEFGLSATQRTSFRSWFLAFQRVLPPVLILQPQWHFQDRRVIILHLPQARLLHQQRQHQATVRLEKERIKVELILLQCLCQVQMLKRW